MRLVNVYTRADAHQVLYDLLKEREPHQCISHKKMPTWDDHVAFVNSNPYRAWYLIEMGGRTLGAIYMTSQREIGLFLFRRFHGEGHGAKALMMMEDLYPGRLLANVSVLNDASLEFFKAQGFHPLQITLEKDDARSH